MSRRERYGINGRPTENDEAGPRDDEPLLAVDRPPSFVDDSPVDRFYGAYLICFVIGMGGLLPWNMIITATDYFSYKFRNPNQDNNKNATETILQQSFENYFAIASTIVQIIFLIINTAMVHIISLNKRMITSVVLVIIGFIVMTSLVTVDTDSYVGVFFGTMMVLVVLMAGAAAIFIGGTFGFCGFLPPIYTQAVMAGQGLAGTFCAGASIVTLSVGGDVTSSALYYFLIGDVMLVLSLILYICLQKMDFYIYYRNKEVLAAAKKPQILYNDDNRRRSSLAIIVASYSPIATIFRKIAFPAFSVCLVFFVTLSLFPAITSKVISVQHFLPPKYFTPVMCFLLFNVADFAGRLLAGVVQIPSNKKRLFAVAVARIILIPLILLCSLKHGHSIIPVVFHHDAFYGLFVGLMAVTNGYFGSIAMMIAPKLVEEKDAETAGVAMCLFTSLGLGSGSVFSLALAALL